MRKPYEGAREEGALGFFKGIGKGVGGLVCGPAAGELCYLFLYISMGY